MENTSSQHRLLSSTSPETKTASSEQSPEEPDIHGLRPEGAVLHHVLNSRSQKWGWVVYRCTYSDEATRRHLKQWIVDENRKSIATSKAPTLIDHLDMVFFEDRARFDGASRDELRVHFNEWRANELSRLGPADLKVVRGARRGESGPRITMEHPELQSSRFQQCIQVDEEPLRSMREEFEEPVRLYGTGHVNFVYADWPHALEDSEDESQEEYENDEVFEPIDGCTEEDVGWMKVAATGLGPPLFFWSDGIEGWQDKYVRPPEVLYT